MRTPFQRAVLQLRNSVILYQQLQSSTLPHTNSSAEKTSAARVTHAFGSRVLQ